MAGKFNALQEWLGIPPQEQPPNYYRVFGLNVFESDPIVIGEAARRVIAIVEGHVEGPNGEKAKKLLPNILAIRKCLLDSKARAAYDAKLRESSHPVQRTSTAAGQALPTRSPAPPAVKPGSGQRVTEKPASAAMSKAPANSPPAPPPLVAHIPPAAAPPPPPAAPVPEPFASAGNSDFAALAELEPAPYTHRRPASKGAKRDRRTGKHGERKQGNGTPSAEDSANPALGGRKKGRLTAVLIGFVAVAGLVVLGSVGFVLYGARKPSPANAPVVADASKKDEPEESAGEPPAATESPDANAAAAPEAKKLASADQTDPKASSAVSLKGATAEITEDLTASAELIATAKAAEPLLALARAGGPAKKVREMIAAGANVDTAGLDGRSLLRLAVKEGHVDLLDELIELKADVNSVDLLGQTPLMSAAQQGDMRLLNRLLDAGAQPDLRSLVMPTDSSGGLTALLVAVRHNHLDAVKLLLEKGANVDLANGQGVTPLMIACWQANSPMVEALLLKEPKLDAVDLEGQTAVMYTAQGGSDDILGQLLFGGYARVTAKSKSGATALGIALARKSAPLVAKIRAAAKNEAPMVDF